VPVDALGTPSCKPGNFRTRVKKAINEAKRENSGNNKNNAV
jgi:hypothetical protein